MSEPQDKKKKKSKKMFRHFEYKMFYRKANSHHITIFLSSIITDPINYAEALHRIHSATENDVVYIHLNCRGGNLETGIQFINAMKSTAAHVITILDSVAYSLGTLIFLSGDELRVHENCMMMFHNYSSGLWGKGNEMTSEIEALNKWFNKVMKKIAIPFLTESEVAEVLEGKDLWMDSDEIRKRLNRMARDENIERTVQVQSKKQRR